LLTDQDNGIIYECPDTEAADEWLSLLATKSNEILNQAGITFCDGGIMARESAMRHNLDGWISAIKQWMKDPDDVRILWISALSDARALYGDKALLQPLQNVLLTLIGQQRSLLRVFAREALQPELPFKKFPSLRLRGNRSKEGPSLNLKRQGTHLITHAARLFCLDASHPNTDHPNAVRLEHSSTSERLSWLAESQPDLQVIAQEALVAYNVLVDMRLSWQVHQASNNQSLTDIMPLENFGETRKRLLLSAYQTVEEVRLRIRHQFGITGL